MTVLEVSHKNQLGEVLFNKYNLKNTLHAEGEEYFLKTLFTDNIIIVPYYHIGLDTRSIISSEDSLSDVTQNESGLGVGGNGYSRQQIAKDSFQIIQNSNGNYQANSPIIQFTCTVNSWSAKNIFLCTAPQTTGFTGLKKLISSVPLGTTLVVSANETVSMRIGLSLRTSND